MADSDEKHRACCGKACGLKRLDMWLLLREGLFLQEHFWRPLSQITLPLPTHRPHRARTGPTVDYCWSRIRLPEFLSASVQLKALARPVGQTQGGELVHGETRQTLSISKTFVYLTGWVFIRADEHCEKKTPCVHKNCC